jgi:hypothetical protein
MSDFIIIVSVFLMGFGIGALTHEADLSRNFKRSGDACAWVFTIKQHAPQENKEEKQAGAQQAQP